MTRFSARKINYRLDDVLFYIAKNQDFSLKVRKEKLEIAKVNNAILSNRRDFAIHTDLNVKFNNKFHAYFHIFNLFSLSYLGSQQCKVQVENAIANNCNFQASNEWLAQFSHFDSSNERGRTNERTNEFLVTRSDRARIRNRLATGLLIVQLSNRS